MTPSPTYRQCCECCTWVEADQAVRQCNRFYCEPCYATWLNKPPAFSISLDLLMEKISLP